MMIFIRSLCFLLILLWGMDVSAQQSIASARQVPEGTEVTVQGILMDDGAFSPNRFLQDSTAAIVLYLPSATHEELLQLHSGSEVLLTGIVDTYRGQVEIRDVSSWELLASDVPLFPPLELPMNQWASIYTGRYIELPAFQFLFPGLPFIEGEYAIKMADWRGLLDYAGPVHTFTTDERAYSMRGFLQQDYSSFILRTADPVLRISKQPFRSRPELSDLDEGSVTVEWTSTGYRLDSVFLYFGEEFTAIKSLADEDSVHQVTLDGLSPSTDYSLEIRSPQCPGRERIRFRTTDGLPDLMEFYFNYPVDTTISSAWTPDGTTGLAAEQAIIDRIDAAREQIDFCMYNISRIEIVRALKRAHNRGVQVRYITDDETSNWALDQTSIPFEVVDGNVGSGLMHNKFIVLDPDLAEDAWLVTGSMNLTTGQVATDYNHLVFIREQSLALTYEQEFEEMWGGKGPFPSDGDFGSSKRSNTPVHHRLFDSAVELYFAPTDRVSEQIRRLLAAADHSIEFALLLLTQDEIGTVLIRSVDEGLTVRGIMENAFGPGSEYDRLNQNGVEVYQDIHSSAIFHHKYAIVDAGRERPRLMTGSYNWSFSAEHFHDENYIVFHHPGIVNVFSQDFRARYCEIADCMTDVEESGLATECRLYPNPAEGVVHLILPEAWHHRELMYRWYNAEGRLLMATLRRNETTRRTFDVSSWPAGMYWLQIRNKNWTLTLPLRVQNH